MVFSFLNEVFSLDSGTGAETRDALPRNTTPGYTLPIVCAGILRDIHGDTVPLGDKIYAIRVPAPTSSPEILAVAQNRTTGIVFNWNKQVGFNRAGDNSRAFVYRPKVKGTYGDLASAYAAAEEFLALPSVHEGPLPETPPENTEQNMFVYLYLLFLSFVRNIPITSKFVIASILLSLFLFASYSTVLRLQEYAGCVPHSNTDFRPSFDTLCQELLKLQLHVQIHSTEYMKVFFAQLKIGFVMLVKHIIDYVFSSV